MRFIPLVFLLMFCGLAFAHTTSKSDSEKKYESVTFTTEDKFDIKADLYVPKMTSNKRLHSDGMARAFILVHGEGGTREQMRELAGRIHRLGFVVLNLDLRGHGESKTEKYDYALFTKEQRSDLFLFAYRDLTAAIQFLDAYREGDVRVHGSQIALLGYGIGATLVLDQIQRREENISHIAVIDPPITEEADYILSTSSLLGEVAKRDPEVVTLFGQKTDMDGLWATAKKSVRLEDDPEFKVKIKDTGDGTIGFYSSDAASNFKPIVDWINDKIPLRK